MHQRPRKIAILATAVAALATAALAAQTQQQPQPGPPVSRAANAAPRSDRVIPITELDRYLLMRLIAFTDGQLALGRLAQEKASRRDLKQLAAEFIQDHTGMQTPLQNILARNTPPPPPAKSTTGGPSSRGGRSSPGGPGDHDAIAARFLQLADEANREFQASALRELSARQGPRFDEAFLHSQIAAQLWLRDALSVFERQASADLQPLLQRWIQIAEYDLNRAKRLELWIAHVGPNGPPASEIFGPRSATSGTASGTTLTPRPRMGLSPLPTTTTTPGSKAVLPGQGSP